MIDTLARHHAALSEARRLLAMVLDRHPSFAAFRDGAAVTALNDDAYFRAYRHISDAIVLIEPELASIEYGDAAKRIADIVPLSAALPPAKTNRLSEALEAAHLELASREPNPVPKYGASSTAPEPAAPARSVPDQSEAAEKELAVFRKALGLSRATPQANMQPPAASDHSPGQERNDAAATVPVAPKTPAATITLPASTKEADPALQRQAAEIRQMVRPPARVINDTLVYTAPKWTESSVEIVRSAETAAKPPPTTPPRRSGWLSRLAGAG